MLLAGSSLPNTSPPSPPSEGGGRGGLFSFRGICFLTKVALFFTSLSTVALAAAIPESPKAYVNDYAQILSQATRSQIETLLFEFEKKTSNQIVVATFESLEGASLEDFSIRLAEKWKIGSKKNDNGVILVIFKNDRQVRIEVGYGLEGALPDVTADLIIRNEMVPQFKMGRYDEGILSAVQAIMSATQGEYAPADTSEQDPIKKYSPLIFMGLIFYLLFPIFCYLLILLVAYSVAGPAGLIFAAILISVLMFLRTFLLSQAAGQTLSGRGRHWGSGGFGGGGFGGFSGGGFSGGGGGSFGGGGASGRW